ncbi:MAG: hypothetical protein R3D00_03765 [Bacteroidia bacterium]
MIRKLTRFSPAFLKNFDKYLLLNHPEIWATRIHFLAWVVFIFSLLSVAMAYLQVNIRYLSNPNDHFWLMFIPGGMIFSVWMYHLTKHNSEREFGINAKREQLGVQAVLMLGIILLLSLPYVYGFSVSAFNASRVSDRELVSEINKINLVSMNIGQPNYSRSEKMPENEDMPQWLNGPEHLSGYVTGADLYFDWQKRSREEKLEMIAGYLQLVEKYNGWQSILVYEPEDILDREVVNPENLTEAINGSYDNFRWTMSEIVQAKEKHFALDHRFMRKGTLTIIIMLLIGLWVLMQIFIKIGWAKFSISVIAGIFLAITGGLVVVSARYVDIPGVSANDIGIILFLGFWALFVYQSYAQASSRRVNYWQIIALTLAVVMTPFIPLVFQLITNIPSLYLLRNELYVIIAGGILTVILWNTIFSQRFQLLSATPQKN